jgi:hypothetical protein
MIRNLTYKQRFYYLLGMGMLVYILSYGVAISGTIKTWHDLKETDVKLKKLSAAPANIKALEKSLDAINFKIGTNQGDVSDFQKTLLDGISSYCIQNGLILKEFPRIHAWQKGNYEFITSYACIEGPFVPLLKLLYKMEVTHATGRIVSVSFFSTEDRRTKKTRLSMSLYIQTIKQIGNVQGK